MSVISHLFEIGRTIFLHFLLFFLRTNEAERSRVSKVEWSCFVSREYKLGIAAPIRVMNQSATIFGDIGLGWIGQFLADFFSLEWVGK